MLDYIFYIFYCSVKKGFGYAERACFLLSSSIVSWFGSGCFLLIVITKSRRPDPITGPGIFFVVAIVFMYATSRYFVASGRYRRIVEKYGIPNALPRGKRILYTSIAWSFYIGSFIVFGVCGMMLSRYLDTLK